MYQFPVPMITNCQNITINYTIFPRKWLSFMSLHTFLFYYHSCWIYCLLLKFGSYIICIRPQKYSGRIMVWRSRRRLGTFCFRCLTLVLVSSSNLSFNNNYIISELNVSINSCQYRRTDYWANDTMQIQPFYEVDTSLYRPKRCISTEVDIQLVVVVVWAHFASVVLL
jgi:hypothetical protein